MKTGPFGRYEGRSPGRILNILTLYCGLNIAEQVQVGFDTLSLHGKPFATVSWDDKDIPTFIFNIFNVDVNHRKEYERRQAAMSPFFNESNTLIQDACFLAQEIAKIKNPTHEQAVCAILGCPFGWSEEDAEIWANDLIKASKYFIITAWDWLQRLPTGTLVRTPKSKTIYLKIEENFGFSYASLDTGKLFHFSALADKDMISSEVEIIPKDRPTG